MEKNLFKALTSESEPTAKPVALLDPPYVLEETKTTLSQRARTAPDLWYRH